MKTGFEIVLPLPWQQIGIALDTTFVATHTDSISDKQKQLHFQKSSDYNLLCVYVDVAESSWLVEKSL